MQQAEERTYLTLGITIISSIEDLNNDIFHFCKKIEAGDLGYANRRLTELPRVFSALLAWENKNIGVISPEDKESFYASKSRIEKLMDLHKIDEPVYIKK